MITPDACNERYSELCALAMTGALSDLEACELRAHVSRCPQCARLLADYEKFISVDMAKLAGERADPEELSATTPSWPRAEAKKKLLAAVELPAVGAVESTSDLVLLHPNSRSWRWLKTLRTYAIAASLLLTAALSYQIGLKQASVHTGKVRPGTDPRPLAAQIMPAPVDSLERASTRAEVVKLQKNLRESNSAIQRAVRRAESDEAQIAELTETEVSLDEGVKRLTEENGTQAKAIESLSIEKTSFQQQLENTRTLLLHANADLESAQQDRQRTLIRAASLETELNTLNGRLRLMASATRQQEQFLASDRDIRELMGARQLYIADVFDVNQDGKNSKAFGRVFYTKGKSLIFYAFDLDRQAGLREAKAFQAWGRGDADRSSAVSLGIFYLDSEANRRWVLKSDDPAVLAQISAVFVTAEPTGGSRKPSGKPFLFAYLRSLPPNHP
jgi:hypothetical protein